MGASVRHLIFILELFFPPELAIQQAIYVLGVLISLYPILRLHANQRRHPRQPPVTGWMKSGATPSCFLFRQPRPILVTSRLDCKFCPPDGTNRIPSLHRRKKGKDQKVWLLDASFRWVSADLVIAHCTKCRADYYPDRITQVANGRRRSQQLEYDAEFLRVSKSGVWVHRKIARSQEKALNRFHSGWSNFAEWVNDTGDDINVKFTYRQAKRLFLEHFARRLLVAHGKADSFISEAHSSADSLSAAVRDVIGRNGGIIPTSLKHGCIDCTHVKRFRSDLVHEGANLDGLIVTVVGSETVPAEPQIDQAESAVLPETLPQQEAPPAGTPRGYTRLAVMDGKTLKHRKCALDDCQEPLVNFKNGRFCQTHLDSRDICGIIPCGRPIREPGALTCDNQAHMDWHKQYEDRFHRLSFPGVQRVIRRQKAQEGGGIPSPGPSLQVQLQALGDTAGEKVVHTFKAKSIYCLQTVQWACGVPVGWGKCYKSESTPQVLSFLNKIWGEDPQSRPSFMVYDKACDLLRHIVTQDPNDLWLKTTKFIVDAWHYIGHQATDVLCRTRCNPAPTNGSQPDLVLTQVDDNGVVHQTRAFNTETAEQLNAWLDGFESQLQQMTDINFDFYIHALMLIYAETVEKKVAEKGRELSEEFWDQVDGISGMDLNS
ncbi:hypothetical protein B0H17DRAFT_1162224 [Mycena rosella]|uniref:CxC6 like cysteine cluster associated with KDZ domain-containing protein n=1 Tax=Mycena rosella TaxID=1033263 RepID=A0AAD7CYK4_MYCRO|nr:hypothetical protein B0H17DRAFT_1162224 [Mycena rosella]